MDKVIRTIFDGFEPLTLDALNAKAAMLERLDNKYIVPADRLRTALDAFRDRFDVLEINGNRAFTYATTYYDDPDLRSYHDHHQRRRKRCKVRIREYLDAGFGYLEVKLKDTRQVTVKKRKRLAMPDAGLDESGRDFVDACHREQYAEAFARPLAPVLGMRYRRITLVAREGGERMTIDTALRFHAVNLSCAVRPDMFILETKSRHGRGLADRILRSLSIRPTKQCSKYCIGMVATRQVVRHNRFLPALRGLGLPFGTVAQPVSEPASAAGRPPVETWPLSRTG